MSFISVVQTIWAEDLEQIGQSTILSVIAGLDPHLVLDDPSSGIRAKLALGVDIIDPETANLSDISFGPDALQEAVTFSVNGRTGNLTLQSLGQEGDATHAFLDSVGYVGKLVTFHQIAAQGADWLVAAPSHGAGLSSYRINSDGEPVLVTQLDDTTELSLRGITALDNVQIGDRQFVLAASPGEDAITLLELGPQGRLFVVDSATAVNYLPIDAPTTLQTVIIGAAHFVVTASFGTGSLTVLEISAGGTLNFVDQLNDTRETRFGGTSALDIVTHEGRTYVAAAGNDMGVSLFQMLPDGRLMHLETFIDQLSTALDGISDLRFVQTDSDLELFALSTRDAGLTRFNIETEPAGNAGAVSTGTAQHDIISAATSQGSVYGYGGDDILLDSAGEQNFFGGSGADIFAFKSDQERDTIRDFNATEDRIDLSGASNIHSANDLKITEGTNGFYVQWDDDALAVRMASGTNLTYDTLVAAFMFEIDRVPMIERAPMMGTADNDIFIWAAGDDTVDGGDGIDRMDYSQAPMSAIVDLADPNRNAMAADGDMLNNIEGVIGTDGDDVFYGDDLANTLISGHGNDALFGGAGNDWLMPGDGAGTVDGGAGVDMLSLLDLSQSARVSLATQSMTTATHTVTLANIENISGTIYADVIEGDSGSNRLRGLGDYDWFLATEGSDSYDGGSGRDMVSYVYAPEAVRVDMNAGQGLAGLALGDTYTSIERITGSIYGDVVFGGVGDEDLRGVGGYDWFIGSPGRDRFDGGSGADTVAYWTSQTGVMANLSLGYGSGGDADRDLFTAIENLTGSSFGDRLTGDNGRNVLRGLGGDDVLNGYGSVDRLEGGAGNDKLDGGWGWDVAVFLGVRSDYTVTSNAAGQTIVADDQSWRDGTDTLDNIEALQFSDGLFYF
jgi:serralysin